MQSAVRLSRRFRDEIKQIRLTYPFSKTSKVADFEVWATKVNYWIQAKIFVSDDDIVRWAHCIPTDFEGHNALRLAIRRMIDESDNTLPDNVISLWERRNRRQ